MPDELTRPLGQKKAARRRLSRPLLLAAVAALCFVLGAAGALFWSGLLAPPPDPGPATAAAPPAPAPAAPPRLKAGGGEEARESDGETAGAGTGTGLEPLDPVEPDGTIEPKLPVPEFRRQEASLAHLPDPELVEEGATGVIPKRSADGLRPMDVYSRPPATEGNFGVARAVIIVGGIGISQSGSQSAVRKLPGAVTLAFAPYGNSLGRWMTAARKAGHELLLQLPMEPFDYPQNDPGPHTLLSGVSPEENLANLHWAMSRITNYVGVMNFLGGKLVTAPDALAPVFDEVARRGLLFVDDGSIKNTASEEVAKASLLPYARARIHIDAIRTRREIAARLDELVKEARRTGLAIGVANAFPDSIDMIAQFARSADKLGIEITPVSAVVSDPQKDRK